MQVASARPPPRFVITEKLDGGNCCLKGGMVFARTHTSPATQPWFSMTKQLYATQIAPLLDGLRLARPADGRDDANDVIDDASQLELYGENMQAVHSIDYRMVPASPKSDDKARERPEMLPRGSGTEDGVPCLESPFYLFAVFDPVSDSFLSWRDVQTVAAALCIPTVPVLFEGTWSEFVKAHLLLDGPPSARNGGRQPPVTNAMHVVRGSRRQSAPARAKGRDTSPPPEVEECGGVQADEKEEEAEEEAALRWLRHYIEAIVMPGGSRLSTVPTTTTAAVSNTRGCLRPPEIEGVVVRTADAFLRHQFEHNVVKYVRKGHNQIDDASFAGQWRRAVF